MAERDERRIVTALFADVAGSTALAERLDAEDGKLVVGEAISRAIRAVEAYGGTVNNLQGDGLLALFGAPVAHEDDPERAVRAGLEIIATSRAYADEVRRSWGIGDFAMRVAIHTGEVVVGRVGAGGRVEYGVFGDTINTTSRLQAAADADAILVSEVTRRQVASRFDWGAATTLRLKGIAKAVTAYPVLRASERSASLTRQASATPMVGRDAELSAALELIGRLATGRGGLLYIVGDPGIGKSRLAAEVRQRAELQANCTWLEGRCVSYGESLPYWPYRDLLRNWLEVSATEPDLRVRVKLHRKTEEAFPGRGSEVYPYLGTILGLNLEPAATARLSPLSPESLQYRTFEIFTELVQQLAARRPLVLALDDLHWADPTSLALTERLLPLAEGGPLMMAISQRPETDHASWLLKEKAAREYRHLFRELLLHPLSREFEAELLSSLVGRGALPPSAVQRLLAYAEGNPFYLEQMVRALMDSGALLPEDGHWRLTREAFEIPDTLEAVIIARVDRLEPEWRETLTSASVLSRTFGLELLEAVTSLEPAALRQAVHHLLRLDLFREEAGGAHPVYRFKHALIQEAAYRTLVAPRRAALHRQAAQWFESFYQERPERVYGLIAHHWLMAADAGEAARCLKLAGDQALTEWALDEAIGHYRDLIPLLERFGRRQEAAETLFQLASTLHLAMRYREANDTWQLAFAEWSPPTGSDPAETATAALRVAVEAMPWDADPRHGYHSANIQLQCQLYDSLFETRRPGTYVVPGLAQGWTVSDDGRVYRLKLWPRLTWNDGAPFGAQDVVEGIKHKLAPATQSRESAHVFVVEKAGDYAEGRLQDFDQVGVHARDDKIVEFRLEAPAPHFIFALASYDISGAMPSRGNGPFRVSRIEPDRVVIERDPGYRRRRGGNLAIVEWVPLRGSEVPPSLQGGQIDAAISGMLPHDAAGAEGMTTIMGPLLATDFLAFPGVSSYAVDLHLRKALAHATDRGVMEPLPHAQSVALGGLVPPGVRGHTPDTVLRFDPSLARQFIERSNHRGPLLLATPGTFKPAYLDKLIAVWRDVLGLDIRTVPIPIAELGRPPEYVHAWLGGWVTHYPDPEYFLHMLLHKRSTSKVTAWSSPRFDALVDRALVQATGVARMALFHEADKLAIQEECAVIPLVYIRTKALVQPWVHGWWVWGTPFLTYDELTIDDRSPRYRGLASRS